jgi:phosphatidylserine decarboxylase
VALIQAKNPEIGVMGVVMVGMAEVSSVEFDDVKEFKKGDEIGRFHFGGSTHCVVFGPKVSWSLVNRRFRNLWEWNSIESR